MPRRRAKRWRRPRRRPRPRRPPSRPRRSPSRCPSRCGRRSPRRWAARRSRTGRCRCLAALPLWAYVYQATLEPAPTGELTPVEEGGAIYKSAACSGCHGAGGGGSASVPGAHRRARDLARLPRPHDVGAARARSAGRSTPTPTAPPTSPSTAACPPTPRSTTRSWRSSCSTSGSSSAAWRRTREEYLAAPRDRRGRDDLRRGRPRRDLRRGGDPRRGPRRRLSAIAGRLGPTGRLTP